MLYREASTLDFFFPELALTSDLRQFSLFLISIVRYLSLSSVRDTSIVSSWSSTSPVSDGLSTIDVVCYVFLMKDCVGFMKFPLTEGRKRRLYGLRETFELLRSSISCKPFFPISFELFVPLISMFESLVCASIAFVVMDWRRLTGGQASSSGCVDIFLFEVIVALMYELDARFLSNVLPVASELDVAPSS